MFFNGGFPGGGGGFGGRVSLQCTLQLHGSHLKPCEGVMGGIPGGSCGAFLCPLACSVR